VSEHKYALGVIGTGHIAAVMIRRFLDSDYLPGERIIVSNSKTLRAHPLAVTVADDNPDVVRSARIVMLAVTPQKFAEAAASIRSVTAGDHIFLSIMAGVSTDRIEKALSANGPARVIGLGRGVTGLCRGAQASVDDLEETRHLLNAGGVTVSIDDEALMDAVTAVAGSGPAYFYYFVEMLMAGGMAAGLNREDAQVLAAHACVGAGAMLLEKGAAPRELREAVTSPGGTTQAAMDTLTNRKVAEHVTEAVLAAFRRGQELGRLTAEQ
jgi:pyrroline-5-carboxylate reductase